MTVRLASLLAALSAAVAFGAAAPASAQSLLDEIAPQQEAGGVCTCAVVQPPPGPFDCDAYLNEVRADLQSQVSEQRDRAISECVAARTNQCLASQPEGQDPCANVSADLRSFCVANRASGACDTDAFAQVCRRQVEASLDAQIAPILNEQRASCRTANREQVQGWIDNCENLERPAACQTCDQESARIVELEGEIADARAWLASMRSGESLISADDEALIAQRLDDIERWERELSSKRTGYEILQDTDFCPRP